MGLYYQSKAYVHTMYHYDQARMLVPKLEHGHY